eukprot:5071833-Prymnesium_polylepis.2
MTEPAVASSDATNIAIDIRRDEARGEYVINGSKWWITGAGTRLWRPERAPAGRPSAAAVRPLLGACSDGRLPPAGPTVWQARSTVRS